MRSVIGLWFALVCQSLAMAAEPFAQPSPGMGEADSSSQPIRFHPAEVALGDQVVGEKSEIQKVTLRNSGSGTARFRNWSVVGDASIESDCKRELAPGEHCELRVRFVPAAVGMRRATVIVVDESHGSLLSLGISGRGVPPVQQALASGGSSARRRAMLPRARPRQTA